MRVNAYTLDATSKDFPLSRCRNLHSYLLNTVTSLAVTLSSANMAAYRQLCSGTADLVAGDDRIMLTE